MNETPSPTSGALADRVTCDAKGAAPSSSPLGSGPLATVRRTGLAAILHPRSIAVIGASERMGSLGRILFENLAEGGFKGPVWPVNRKERPVFGQRTVPSVLELPDVPDLAIVAVPAAAVATVLEQCAERGIPGVIVLSAGIPDLVEDGDAATAAGQRPRQLLRMARASGMRVMGPNCLGVMVPAAKLNATFVTGLARPGRVAFLSQSGALCAAAIDWSRAERIGLRAVVSLGDTLDIGWGDALDFFGQDAETSVILCYVESLADARAFLSTVRRIALSKPVVVLKGGRTPEASQAVRSHTGALAGSELVFAAAMRRAGVIQVDDLESLFAMAEVLAKQPPPRGKKLTVLTNAGGPAVLATDALIEAGGELAPLSPGTMAKLDAILPPHWSHRNPIDIGGDATPQRYERAIDCVLSDPESDGLLVIQTPQSMSEPLETARLIAPHLAKSDKTVLTSWIGGTGVQAARDLFQAASVPSFEFSETAARSFGRLSRHADGMRVLYETPQGNFDLPTALQRREVARTILECVRREHRTMLSQQEAIRLLTAYGIPTVRTDLATTEDEAVALARHCDGPCVLKLSSLLATHKTDVQGVELNLSGDSDVRLAFRRIAEAAERNLGPTGFQGVTVQPHVTCRDAYELILGASFDDQFGPVVLFGSGGTLVEVNEDRALELPPLTTTLARRLIERTRIARALKGFRGREPVDQQRLVEIVVAFGELVLENPEIREADINPLLASPTQIVALDARVLLHSHGEARPPVRPALRPYPLEYVQPVELRDGTPVVLRPIRPEDEPELGRFLAGLSNEAIHHRYFESIIPFRRTEHRRLVPTCLADFESEMTLVAELAGSREIIGLTSLDRCLPDSTADFGILVADAWQQRGLGRLLLERLIDIGRREGLSRIEGPFLAGNFEMAQLCRDLGFHLEEDCGDRTVVASLSLAPA